MLDGTGFFEESPDVFGEVGRDGEDEEGGDADPPLDEGAVHAEVGGDFAVPVAGGLEFVEGEFESVLVICAVGKTDVKSM